MIVTTAQLFKVAYGKFAIGAYNINNAEQTMGLFKGCLDSQAPFIIQISKGARKYTDKRMLEAIIRSAEQIFPEGAAVLRQLRPADRPVCLGTVLRRHCPCLRLARVANGPCRPRRSVVSGDAGGVAHHACLP